MSDHDPTPAVPSFKKTEVKYAVVPADAGKAMTVLSLAEPSPVERQIWFFDTATLDLFGQGLILRARKTIRGDEPHDVTVKLRGDRVAAIGPEHLNVTEGKAKIEGDQAGTDAARPAYSHTVECAAAAIDAVAGGAAVETLFSSEQRKFLAEFMQTVTLAALAPRGPVPAKVWKLAPGVFPHELTAELWQVTEPPLLEISDKLDAAKAPSFASQLVAFLGEKNSVRFDPTSKTEFVLKHFPASAPSAGIS